MLLEGLGVIQTAGPHIGDDIFVDVLQIGQLLIEMARQQERGVGQVAFGNLDGALAVLQRKVGGTERNRQHQRGAAQDQPLDRAHAAADQRPRSR